MSVLIQSHIVGRMYINDIDKYIQGNEIYTLTDKEFASSKVLQIMLKRKFVTIYKEQRRAHPEKIVIKEIQKETSSEDISKIVESVVDKVNRKHHKDMLKMKDDFAKVVKDSMSSMPGRAESAQSKKKKKFVDIDGSVMYRETDKDVEKNIKVESKSTESNKDALAKLKALRNKK